MQQHTTNFARMTVGLTVGLDVGDRYSYLCALDAAGEVVEEGRIPTTAVAIQRRFVSRERMRIVLETGTHSPWISRLLSTLGHEVLVANARRLRLIAEHDAKSDRVDAETLARLGRADPTLLAPIRHRSEATQADLAVVRARDALVRVRTLLVNHVRGAVKAVGGRLPKCSTHSFPRQVGTAIPDGLMPALGAVLATIEQLSRTIRTYDRRIAELSVTTYPETASLQQVAGVGPVTALCYVLTLEDPTRFTRSRSVGSYLGLRPKQDDSGRSTPQLRITKAGDGMLRRLLVGSAHYLLGPFGPDCDLRRWGLRLAARGGKNAKKRAVVAVARKLAVLLHRLWSTGEVYEPLRCAAIVEESGMATA
jgi:transposase